MNNALNTAVNIYTNLTVKNSYLQIGNYVISST